MSTTQGRATSNCRSRSRWRRTSSAKGRSAATCRTTASTGRSSPSTRWTCWTSYACTKYHQQSLKLIRKTSKVRRIGLVRALRVVLRASSLAGSQRMLRVMVAWATRSRTIATRCLATSMKSCSLVLGAVTPRCLPTRYPLSSRTC